MNQKIIALIQSKIKEHGIGSLLFEEAPKPGKTIISIFELHFNPVPTFLIHFIANIFKPDFIGIEQAIEHTSAMEDLKHPETMDEGIDTEVEDPYQKSLKVLSQLVPCPIVCIDAPEEVRGSLSAAAAQSRKAAKELDSLRNAFMAHTLVHFLPGRSCLTINGLAHYADLKVQLRALDNQAKMMSIIYKLGTSGPKAKVSLVEKGEDSFLEILAPNEESLKDPIFCNQLREALIPHPKIPIPSMGKIVFFLPLDRPYPYLREESKDAMLIPPAPDPL